MSVKKNTEKFLEAKKICSNIKHFPTETLLSTAGVALIKTYNLLLTDNPSEKPQPEKDKDKEKEKDKYKEKDRERKDKRDKSLRKSIS